MPYLSCFELSKIKLIIDRYGDLEFHYCPSSGTCGQEQVLNPDKSMTLHYGPYIRNMLKRIGMYGSCPPSSQPRCQKTSQAFSGSNSSIFRRNCRILHNQRGINPCYPSTPDTRKVITHLLLTRNESPDKSDYLKQLHLLRNLKFCPDLGPTFFTDPNNYPNGVEIHSAYDCAHNNVHVEGKSHGAYQITIGKPGATTFPFCTYSAKKKGVSLHPHEGEYVILSHTAKQLLQ